MVLFDWDGAIAVLLLVRVCAQAEFRVPLPLDAQVRQVEAFG
jgi:hypothetical protein